MTTRIITDQPWRGARWARTIPGAGDFVFERFTALLLEKDLYLKAAVFYTNWHPQAASIDLHIASAVGENWLTRPFLRAAFRYPFLELGCRRIGALVRADNARSLRFTQHIGFVMEGVHREAAAPGVDVISFGMLKSECRWLKGPAPETWAVETHGVKTVTAETA